MADTPMPRRLPVAAAATLWATCAATAQVVWEAVPLRPPTPVAGVPDHRMVWDEVRQRVQLIDGFGDVFEWNGGWSAVHVAAFPPSAISIAYEASRRRTLLHSEGLTWQWDGARWTQLFPASSPPFRRNENIAYDAARDRVVLFGGRDALGRSLGDTWEWDGGNWIQRFPATSPSARWHHAMAYDSARNRTVLAGGNAGSGATLSGETWEWDGSTWVQRPSLPAPLPQPDMAYDAARRRVVLYGSLTSLVYEWDGSQWTQPAATPPSPFVFGHSMAYHHARQRVVLWGGDESTWEWDGRAWTRFDVSVPRSAADEAALCYDSRRARTLLFGRSAGSFGETWEWDGARWLERPAALAPFSRTGHALAYDEARGRAVLFGGLTSSPQGDTWEWDGSQWLQQLVAMPPSRSRHAMAYDAARRRVVMTGGFTGTVPWQDTWEWDGTGWHRGSPAVAPAARGDAALAYDPVRQRSVLFGGSATSSAITGPGQLFGDTWEWDGTSWTRLQPAVSPAPRRKHAMVWDGARQRIVLFGGERASGVLTDTWEWDGARWQRRLSHLGATTPGGAEPALAYDAARQRVVLYDDLEQIWEYRTLSPAAYAPFGEGCAGPAGAPLLGAASGSLPWAESSFTVQLAPIVAGQPAVLFFGVSSTSWSGIPLPLALGVLGRPDCSVLASLDLAVPLASATGAAALTIPLAPSLVGGVFYNQGASLDLTSGAAGLAFSNGARAEVGAR